MKTAVLLSIIATSGVVASLLVKLCYKSKCSQINLCYGAVLVERQVEREDKIKLGEKGEEDLEIV